MRRYAAAIARRVRPLLRGRPRAEPPLSAATIDLRTPQVVRDPFPYYEALRQEGPVLFLPRHDYWIVLGHEAVRSAFARPEHFSNAPYRDVDAVLLAADPPEQTAMRRTVARLFSPADSARLEETAERLANGLVKPELDVVADYGLPISRGVTADLLGLDRADAAEIVAAEARSYGAPDPLADFVGSLDSMAHRTAMFGTLMATGMPVGSARSLIRLMWLAGTTTSQRVIARAILRLIEGERDQQALRADPALVRPFLEEVLRLHPPEHMVPRLTRADVALDGVTIPAGADIRLCVSAANRDPAHILAGTFYLRLMYDRFGYPGLFGAYNAGPGAYAAWLAGNRRLPGETVTYLDAVGGTSQPTSPPSQAAVPPPLFVVRRIVPGDQSSPTGSEAQASLFAVRNVGP